MADASAKVSLRVLMLGDSGVGKSSLMTRFIEGRFSQSMTSTIGIDYASKIVNVAGTSVRLTIWDTAGQERFRSMAAGYYKGSDGVVMVYDVTNKASLANVRRWMTELRGRVSDAIDVALVGNKADMDARRQVSAEEGRELAASVGAGQFLETSCRSGDNVAVVYQGLAESVMARRKAASSATRPRKISEGLTLDDDSAVAAETHKRGCC